MLKRSRPLNWLTPRLNARSGIRAASGRRERGGISAPNATLLRWMINQGYENAATLARRIAEIEAWLANPSLLVADENAEYAAVIEIDLRKLLNLSSVRRTIRMTPGCCREVARTPIDEVFIGLHDEYWLLPRAAGKLLLTPGDTRTSCGLAPPDENVDASACQ